MTLPYDSASKPGHYPVGSSSSSCPARFAPSPVPATSAPCDDLRLIEVNGNWSLLAGWQVRCGADVHGACARWITRTGSTALAHLPPWGLRKWCHQELFALQRYNLGKHPIAPCVSSCLVSATLSTIGKQAERTCHCSYAPNIDLRHL